MKIVGPLVLGERPPSERMLAMTGLVAPALLAAFVLYETFSANGHGITLDARAAGLGAAIVAILAARPDDRRRADRGRGDGGRCARLADPYARGGLRRREPCREETP